MLTVKDLRIGPVGPFSFDIAPGERVGLVGDSGSGKSLTALAIMGLLPDSLTATGSIRFEGEELIGMRDKKLRQLPLAMVFQEPMTALDPLQKVAEYGRFPHQLSGGQRQRALIHMAMSRAPKLLICDEPTTALDAIVQAEILELLDRLVRERGMALLFISHDLAVVRRMTDRVLVFKGGRMMTPDSDYAKALAAAAVPGPPAAPVALGEPVVTLDGVSLRRGHTLAVDGVDLTVRAGERLAIVGGSGSGKTSLLHLIAGLREPTAGTVRVQGDVQMVFQDPYSSLDPRMAVRTSIREAGVDAARADEVLARVGLEGTGDRTPRQFSGGQRQRISIARAAAPRPSILLADEPVSSLDATIQDQVLDLLRDTVGKHTLVFVTHDLRVARELCPTVAVMRHGRIVEHGATEEVWAAPQHPYTRELLDAVL